MMTSCTRWIRMAQNIPWVSMMDLARNQPRKPAITIPIGPPGTPTTWTSPKMPALTARTVPSPTNPAQNAHRDQPEDHFFRHAVGHREQQRQRQQCGRQTAAEVLRQTQVEEPAEQDRDPDEHDRPDAAPG